MLATKVFFPMGEGPGARGLSRRAIMEQVDASLTRLGTDYVDLYQIHRFDPAHSGRGDDGGPARRGEGRQGPLPRRLLDVGVAVRQDAVRRGPCTAGPASSRCRTSTASSSARRSARCSACCADQGVGSIPWSPLAKGRLARPWGERTRRSENDPMGQRYVDDANPPIVAAVQQVAEARGIPMAQVALAWVLRNPSVAAPIVGPTKPHHLHDAVAARRPRADRRRGRRRSRRRTRSGCPQASADL